MAQRWKALILTQSNILQNVEIETPGISRSDAIAQVKSTYGAKEVKFCNPISSSSSSSSSSGGGMFSSSDSSDGSLTGLLIIGGLVLIYVFRYVILVALIIGALYLLYKWIKK